MWVQADVVNIPELPENLSGPEGDETLAWEVNGKIVAAMTITNIPNDSLYLEWISVLPKFRGMGYSKKLVQYLQSRNRIIYTEPTNSVAVSLFESLGFRPIGKRKIPDELNNFVSSETYVWGLS